MDADGGNTTNVQEGWGVGEIENSALVRATYGLIAAVGLGGNLLVCLVMLRMPSLRGNTSDFLVHLALVDCMVCLWAIPFHLFPHVPSSAAGLLGEVKCRMYTSKYPLWVTMLTSIFNLVAVNLERYVAIVHPHKYKSMYKPRNKRLMLAACWALSVLSNWYFFLVYDVDGTGSCLFVGWGSYTLQALAGVYVMSAFVLGPLLIMVISQWRVISTLNKQVRRLTENHQGTAEQQAHNQREMWQLRAAQELQKTLVFVMVTYAVCWAPTNTIYLAFNLGAAVNFAAPYYHVSVILGVANSCLNPIIYTMKNRPFRMGVRKLFGCAGRDGRVGVAPHQGNAIATGGATNSNV